MNSSFELFDVDSGNLVGSYATEDDAWAIVKQAYACHGLDNVSGRILLETRGDEQVLVADEDDIVRVATSS